MTYMEYRDFQDVSGFYGVLDFREGFRKGPGGGPPGAWIPGQSLGFGILYLMGNSQRIHRD